MSAAHNQPKIPCDVCGAKAVGWFRETCVALCNKDSCYQQHETAWQEELQRLQEEAE